ncbi:MAG: hypothetical protein ABI627_13665 [Polyangiaceae bacterium]
MNRKYRQFSRLRAGAGRPCAGVASPEVAAWGVVMACCVFATGCGSQADDRNLEPAEVGMTKSVAPIFNDGETQLFEVKRGLQFPIVAPTASERSALGKNVEPYGRTPWITNQDVKVQLTWTLSNLDDSEQVVEVLIDPWNEFGRYYPGMQLADANEQKFEPNLSGIDHYFVLAASSAGESSRRHGTFTFDDMNEMAIDFATVQAMIKHPPPLPGGVQEDPDMMTDPLPIYANHAFNTQNRSYNDVLVAPYIPQVIAGLTGVDFGFRVSKAVDADCMTATDDNTDAGTGTSTKICGGATVALEVAIEIVDQGKGRVQEQGGTKPLLKATTEVVTVGSPVPSAM